jgi:hypothetical protein
MSDFVKAVNAVTAANKVCITNGLNLIAGGTGFADVTIGTPSPGHRAVIRVDSITSGDVVVTCVGGTFDGTNDTATLDAANESLEIEFYEPDEWAVVKNIGGVALS